MADFEPQLTKRFGLKDSHTLKTYLETGGYASLKKLFTMTPVQVIDEVKASNLKGRGGAGFPAGMKWSFVPQNTGKAYLPGRQRRRKRTGTFSDRFLLMNDPHLLIEGINLRQLCHQLSHRYIYCRG